MKTLSEETVPYNTGGWAGDMKKGHLRCCLRPPRSDVLLSTPPLVGFSRALHLEPF